MNALHDNTVAGSAFALPFRARFAAERRPACKLVVRRQRDTMQIALRSKNCRTRSEEWGSLMIAAQGGQSGAYEQLFRELDAWLCRYYKRRLPRAAAEDAKQDALLAIHAKRDAYSPSRPFGPWIAAIARNKWIDQIRNASRFAAVSLHSGIAIEGPVEHGINLIAVDELLKRLKPAQASVIRLVKLQGLSVEDASDATGQSAALVKVNIHRGLKKLTAMATSFAKEPSH
jgi:RNA polymerase sigma factor (sigma-70 family)